MMRNSEAIGTVLAVPARRGSVRDWQRWAPYAAVAWSLIYASLGIYWALSRGGFPYAPEVMYDGLGPMIGRFGPGVAWIVVMTAGIPAAVLGTAMVRGVRGRVLRPLFITAGALIAGVLLLLMTALDLLIMFGYSSYAILCIFTGVEFGRTYLAFWTQWTTIHQLLCLLGGFLWLAATVIYARQSADACLVCGRQDDLEGWTSPNKATRWGRTAVSVAIVVPIFYALTRYAWALGFPLGMDAELFRAGQESGKWIGAALTLGNFNLLGAFLMLGLVQRWGETFPRWMIGLAGRRVPIGLAVVPASLVSVLLVVGGIGIWSVSGQMIATLVASGAENREVVSAILFELGPTLLFPVWGVGLAVASLGYYYRRRGSCSVCGRGTLFQPAQPQA
jgi:hypothetical protein